MTKNNQQIIVQGHNISYLKNSDYISLTDIAKRFGDVGLIANLEYHNAPLIYQGIKEQGKRAEILYNEAQRQFQSLLGNPSIKKLK